MRGLSSEKSTMTTQFLIYIHASSTKPQCMCGYGDQPYSYTSVSYYTHHTQQLINALSGVMLIAFGWTNATLFWLSTQLKCQS